MLRLHLSQEQKNTNQQLSGPILEDSFTNNYHKKKLK